MSTPTQTRLDAPEPGWTVEADVAVVGSGIAGLSTALRYVQRTERGRVVLVTKDRLSTGSTAYAQGGIAAAMAPEDGPVAHMVDTHLAGAGLSDPHAVNVLATEGPDALRWLIGLGAEFDRADDGGLALTREGGHRADRVAHAGGDATGAEIQRALVAAVLAEERIEAIEHAVALDTLRDPGTGAVRGATLHVMGEGARDGVGAVLTPAVVLATGGMGQIFAATTNPPVSTGDGLALAARAGARLRDLEFIQFHPTVLWLGPEARGRQPLVSEALRGEGAYLVDAGGDRIMEGVHELADLAPRDVVARTIARTMAEQGVDHVYLETRHFGRATWERRFPTILASCREHGIDPLVQPVPVAPAAHYASGGAEVDIDGRTSVPGLWAVGEVARTGVHGANRLASNSLLEGLVYADRIARRLAEAPPVPRPARGVASGTVTPLADPACAARVRTLMSRHAGVLRTGEGLAGLAAELDALARPSSPATPDVAAWETANLLTVARLVAAAALHRTESRGSHQRADHPEPRPGLRIRPVVVRLEGNTAVTTDEDWTPSLPPELVAELDAITLPLAGPGVGGVPEASDVPSAGSEPGTGEAGGSRLPGRPDPDSRAEFTLAHTAPSESHVDLVRRALSEDLTAGPGIDVTTVATIPADQVRTAHVVARADGTVSGLPLAELVFWMVCDGALEAHRTVEDGAAIKRGDVLMTVNARTRDLLTAERTALNFLTHMSGIATATRAWVDAVTGTGARIRDSRKTRPGLRALEKYAVRCGGGVNHRYGLSDAGLVKDNHVVAAGGVGEAVRAIRAHFPDLPLEVEVDRIDQIEDAIAAGAEEILLDNFPVERLREAVALVAGRARLESSGGLTLDVAGDVARTGVDYLAVGALTHSSPALDIALDLL
ncbi:nicotinate-nucleotide pyrophosphorylase (carboxylating) [Nocardiopsis arvandica]|uniref:L-aspartate oxidase n=1 Tax=Nocardiopsis sinuspersici TaxID=501010 RepID=A0A7Z0BKJ9_9ACTN|nr:L-aspartate oxidase [Nocardiopsis sinuspersici]NYH53250.1 nicotinate-nucleotide pyrophosphorylase (carboxylating) [Nocardiopsis sinuspersici]